MRGQVIGELDAQVTVDGEVQPVEAELLGPPRQSTQNDDNATRIDTHDNNDAGDINVVNELSGYM